eukprot:TRINITY_DN792_c0_g1_i9.p1 TRINITY_DN792_c0_g1~~TRINITY_DN792_c0_g1_i9.p1  ORF type:complete len:460 (+),score=91.33 TRINITY_DN792_c0_g1_i9:72-1382(+)
MFVLSRIFVFLLSACAFSGRACSDGECESDAAAMLQVNKQREELNTQKTWTAVSPVEFRDRTQRRATANRHRVFACGSNSEGQLGQGLNSSELPFSSKPLSVKKLDAYTIVEVEAAEDAAYFRTSDGIVLGVGENNDGELGLPAAVDRKTLPVIIPGLYEVKEVITGEDHVLFLHEEGTVSGLGENDNMQLTRTGKGGVRTPTKLKGAYDIVTGSAGEDYNILINKDSLVLVNGENSEGQLGLSDPSDRFPPEVNLKIKAFGNAKAVAAGEDHSLVALADGKVLSFGRNDEGQLCNGKQGGNQTEPLPVLGLPHIVQVASGDDSSYFLSRDGDVYACGENDDGELGVGSDKDNVLHPTKVLLPGRAVKIAVGENQAHFLMADGKVFGTGQNDEGQLCNGNTRNTKIPVPASVGGAIDISIGPDGSDFIVILAKEAF